LFRDLVTCSACGLIYYPRLLAPAEVQELYGPSYFQGAEYFDYLADRAVHEMNFRQRVRQLSPWLPRHGRLFEIGCSYGLFLNQARKKWSVRGSDIAAEPCRVAREQFGLDVQCADFLDVDLAPGALDAVCLWDTIEHLDRAEEYLVRIANILPAGGVLALTTGDIGSALARRQGERWRQIHPPTHLWYFSLATMRRTLVRFGFEVVWSRPIGLFRSLGQIVYSLTSLGKPQPTWSHRVCMGLGLGRLPIWLNTFDLMMVVARRTGSSPVACLPSSAAA
jgi:SAM-dependent methyltransferase